MIHRETFENDYNHFWMLNPTERSATDASLVALIFVMLAMGTQFVDLPSMEEKEQTAEFYGTSVCRLSISFANRLKYRHLTKRYACFRTLADHRCVLFRPWC